MKKKDAEQAFAKHPLAGAEAQVQQDYIQGLVFVALEDENFSQEEKDYMTQLMQKLDMDTSLLEGFESFASDAEDVAISDFMERLGAFDEGLKMNFMVEVVLLGFKDGDFDASEQAIFDDYGSMLGVDKDTARLVRQLAESIANQDMDMALSLYAAKKDVVEPLKYLFELVDMHIDDELAKLYSWEWVKWELELGEIEDDNLIARKPVTVRQIVVFFNALLLDGRIEGEVSEKCCARDSQGNLKSLIEDLSICNVQFENGLFSYQKGEADKEFVGASTSNSDLKAALSKEVPLPDVFANWVNPLIEHNVALLHVSLGKLRMSGMSGMFGSVVSSVVGGSFIHHSSTKSYLTQSPEVVFVNIKAENLGDCYRVMVNNDEIVDYREEGLPEQGNAYAFRLMKLSKEDGANDT